MSDDDNSKLLGDLGDLDWDSALDDWEKNTFVPEVARDAETNKVAPPLEREPTEAQAREHLEAAGSAPNLPAAGAAQGSLRDVSSEGTVIAPVPRELRTPSGHPAPGLHSSKPPLAAPPPRPSAPPGAPR
ncbi:MAG: Exonuclease SbcC, partial [Labilithrix sp.]|nr:Exonuclease SbcC [Labilithrix sp.]